MAREVFAQIGSGTLPFTTSILPPAQRGTEADAQGHRGGTQVMIGNPEDMLAVDAFAVSGITIGTTPIEIVNPAFNPLPRTRQVIIQNLDGTNDVFIGHKSTDLPLEGFQLSAVAAANGNSPSQVTLPLLHNVSVWAAASAGSVQVRMIFV